MTSSAQRVHEVVQPVVAAAGLALDDVVVTPAGRRSVVRVVVDLTEDAIGSLDSDSLGAVSSSISAALDRADPVAGSYVLEVSTPGVGRPLTELRHFRRARTRLVRLVLRDGSVVRGRLTAADPGSYELTTTEGPLRLDPADVVRGEVEVEFGRADKGDS